VIPGREASRDRVVLPGLRALPVNVVNRDCVDRRGQQGQPVMQVLKEVAALLVFKDPLARLDRLAMPGLADRLVLKVHKDRPDQLAIGGRMEIAAQPGCRDQLASRVRKASRGQLANKGLRGNRGREGQQERRGQSDRGLLVLPVQQVRRAIGGLPVRPGQRALIRQCRGREVQPGLKAIGVRPGQQVRRALQPFPTMCSGLRC